MILRLILLFALSMLCIAYSLTQGSVTIPFSEIISPESALHQQVVWELRLPRIISAFIVGGSLAMSGALMQVLLRNPLADPYILGVSGGAAVGALSATLLGISGVFLHSMAFTGAMITTALVFMLARDHGRWNSTRLLLTGVVLAAGWGAIISLLLSLSTNMQMRGMIFWLMGDFSHAEFSGLTSLLLITGLLVSLFLSRSLNLMISGDRQAAALGVETHQVRVIIYITASLLTASAVTLAGPIGFVGLIIPHLLRLSGFRDHRYLLPGCLLAGGSLLMIADTISRSLIAPAQLPVGVITALIGVPLFLLLLHKQMLDSHVAT
ncbi:MAG: iron ABC transporter permease [Gammaproteobacteria bacterium]